MGDGTDPDATPLQRKNGTYNVAMRDMNKDGLRDLQLIFSDADANLGLAAPSTTLVLRGSTVSTGGQIVIRGQITVNVTP